MSRLLRMSSIALALTLTNTVYAGEWKKVYPQDSKIELRTDWSWTARGMGSYRERWNSDNSIYYLTGGWSSALDEYPRIEILLERLMSYMYWKPGIKVTEEKLTWWNHLDRVGVSDLQSLPCDGLDCATFKAGSKNCVGFEFVDGTLGSPGDQGSDLVAGYYCSDEDEKITSEQINEILSFIVIKKKQKWN